MVLNYALIAALFFLGYRLIRRLMVDYFASRSELVTLIAENERKGKPMRQADGDPDANYKPR